MESDDAEESKVLEELQAGYMLNEHVLRPAMVKVVKNKPDIVEEEVKPKDEEDYVSQEAPEEIEPDEYDESDE